MPSPVERCACPQSEVAKRAALQFDRIYVWPWKDSAIIPPSVKFDIPGVDELMTALWDEYKQELFSKSPKMKESMSEFTADDTYDMIQEFFLKLRVECFRRTGHSVTPVYATQERYFLTNSNLEQFAYQAALENLPEIIEEQVSWEQILGFCYDEETIGK